MSNTTQETAYPNIRTSTSLDPTLLAQGWYPLPADPEMELRLVGAIPEPYRSAAHEEAKASGLQPDVVAAVLLCIAATRAGNPEVYPPILLFGSWRWTVPVISAAERAADRMTLRTPGGDFAGMADGELSIPPLRGRRFLKELTPGSGAFAFQATDLETDTVYTLTLELPPVISLPGDAAVADPDVWIDAEVVAIRDSSGGLALRDEIQRLASDPTARMAAASNGVGVDLYAAIMAALNLYVDSPVTATVQFVGNRMWAQVQCAVAVMLWNQDPR
jgi:hypothetical protein